MSQSNCELTVGSKYKVKLPEDEDVYGHFVGYSMIGTESALVIKMDGDRLRYIPVAQIVYLDLLESVEEPEHKERPERLYG